MSDVHDKSTRSKNMRAIRSEKTAPEQKVTALLAKIGLSFRRNVNELPGKPDIVIEQRHIAILVQGCFWHGHQCHLFHLPATRTEFWREKINGTILRDRKNIARLLEKEYRLLLLWECALKGKPGLSDHEIMARLEEFCFSESRLCQLDCFGLATTSVESIALL